MRSAFALYLLLCSTAAFAQPDARAVSERELLRKVVEIPTVPGRGEMPKLTRLLSAEFKKAGLTDIVIKPHGDTQTMVARWRAQPGSARKPILLLAHMDVVEAKASDWTHDPFKMREADGYYWARGVNDNKAGLVTIVSSLARLKASGFRPDRDIIVLFTGDEENNGDGARLAASEWRPLIDADYALNSDGGGGALFKDGRAEGFYLQVAEKSYADYRMTALNPGGHSSAPRPDNAIYQLAGALKALEEYRFTPALNEATRAHFEHVAAQDKGAYGSVVRAWLDDPENVAKADLVEANEPGQTRTRCVATQLSGGHAPNALPQKAEALVNCRILPGTTPTAIREELQAIAGRQVQVTLVGSPTYADASPMRPDVAAAYHKAVTKRFPGAAVLPAMSAGATDGAFLRAAGIPTYGVAAQWGYLGEPEGAHGLNERIPVKAFHDQIDIWEDMIRELAGPAATP